MKHLFLTASIAVLAASCFKKDDNTNAKCPIAGMEGDDCQTETRAKLIGLWQAENYNPAIAKASATTDVHLMHFAGFQKTMIQASFDGAQIKISNQRINDTVSVSGVGEVYKDEVLKINWSYTLTFKGAPVPVNENWVEL